MGRPGFVDAVSTHGGLRVVQGEETTTVSSVTAVTEPVGGVDLVILAVKSYDTASAAEQIVATCGTDVPVLSVQNGVGNEQTLANAGCRRVLAGSLTTPVSVLAPGTIRIDKANSAVGLAAWSSAATPGDLDRVCGVFGRSAFATTRYDDPASLKWTKLLLNIVGNATSAILNQNPEEVFAEPSLVDLEIGAWREALQVMKASAIKPVKVGSYPFNLLGPAIRVLPRFVIRPILRSQVIGGRGDKMPSLHIDVYGGRGRSEVGWLNGAIVDQGEQVGVETPINRLFSETVTSMVGDVGEWDAARLVKAASA